MGFYVFVSESRNQRGETVCTGIWTQHRAGGAVVSLSEGDPVELEVTPDPFVTVRYAGASGDFNPIHIDEEFAKSVGPARPDPARAVDDGAGGPRPHRRRRRPRAAQAAVGPVPRDGADGRGDRRLGHGPLGARTGSRSSTRRPSSRATGSSATRSRKSQSTDRRSPVRPATGREAAAAPDLQSGVDAHFTPGARAAQGRRGIPRGRVARGLEGAVGGRPVGPVDDPQRAREPRGARPARAPAHVRGPRSHRGRLPLFRRPAAAGERSGARAPRLSLSLVRRELDEAMRVTTETLSQVTNLLAIVTAPPIETSTIRHVEVLLLQPQVLMVVVITSTGGVTKRLFTFARSRRSGPRRLGGELSERAAGRARARRSDPPEAPPRPVAVALRVGVPRRAGAGVHRARGRRARRGVRRGHLAAAARRSVRRGVRAERADGHARAPRDAARGAAVGAERARRARPDRRRERRARPALAGAGGRRLRAAAAPARDRVGDRPAADGLRPRDHVGPGGGRRSCRASSPRSTTSDEQHARLLRGARRHARRRRGDDQEGVPAAGPRASPRRQPPRPRRRGEVQGGRRGVRGPVGLRAPRHLRPLRPRGPAQRRVRAELRGVRLGRRTSSRRSSAAAARSATCSA